MWKPGGGGGGTREVAVMREPGGGGLKRPALAGSYQVPGARFISGSDLPVHIRFRFSGSYQVQGWSAGQLSCIRRKNPQDEARQKLEGDGCKEASVHSYSTTWRARPSSSVLLVRG